MKYLIFVGICIVIVSAFYTDVNEKINLKEVLKNMTEVHKYVDCFLDKGPCTDVMMSYKKHFNEAINDACAECTKSQKHIVEEFVKVIVAKYPNDLTEIKKKYDPEGTHFQKLLVELAKY